MTTPSLARWALPGLLILAAAPLAGCTKIGAETQKKGAAAKAKKDPVITTAKPVEIEVQESMEFTGRTEPVQSVNVRARVTGYLIAGGTHTGGPTGDRILFHDGDEVEEGKLLFEIDPRPYQAELDRTRATLKQAEAKLKRQDQNFRRVATLFSNSARSRDEYDQAEDEYLEAQAAVGIATANVATAELNVGFTKVTAPLAGRLSRRMVDIGNLVKADDTILMQIEDIHQLYVVYDVDERSVLKIREMIRAGTFTSMREGKLIVDIALADDIDFRNAIPGVVNFSETNLDANTGTLRLRADVENQQIRPNGLRALSPGQFVKVRLPLGSPYRSLSIPEEAMMSDQGNKYIYLFAKTGDDSGYRLGEVERRNKLVLGPLRDGRQVIREGVGPNDEVIVTGHQGVRPKGKARAKGEAGGTASKADEPRDTPTAGAPAGKPAAGPSK